MQKQSERVYNEMRLKSLRREGSRHRKSLRFVHAILCAPIAISSYQYAAVLIEKLFDVTRRKTALKISNPERPRRFHAILLLVVNHSTAVMIPRRRRRRRHRRRRR